MKNFKSTVLCFAIVICGLLFAACSAYTSGEAPSLAPQTNAPTVSPQGTDSPAPTSTQGNEATAEPGTGAVDGESMAQKTKDFILTGQQDRPEADQYHWTKEFLNLLDMESLYQDYIAAGGKADDVESFAEYLTQNAPVPDNWKEMFEAAFAQAYGEKITKYEKIQNTFYQVYVEMDGSEVPYIVVDSRTGYYHG